MNEWLENLKNPPPEWRAKPFWAWNGKLDRDELLRQVNIMKEMGNGGFFMHSRVGLQTEYLGQEWFDCINACADEAEKLGMEAWLYDEDRWPSGIAGGFVTLNPQYGAKTLKMEICPADSFVWDESILCAFSCKLDGAEFYDCKRLFPDSSMGFKRGDILVFRAIRQSPHSFYNGYTYVDTLSSEATQCFIERTHEKYKALCGDRLGRSIKGIFTDEPFRGILLNDIIAGNDGDNTRVPWTERLPEEFVKKFGYDLRDHLPELFLLRDGMAISQVKWHYVELVLEMFIDNFLKPVQRWCGDNGIMLTGHMFHEDTLAIQTITCGSVMRCYEYLDYPGVDVLKEGNVNYWIVKQLVSAGRQTGKERFLSELNGCTGWQVDFEGYKRMGDWQAFYGINLRCQHLSWYTMEGQAKRDYPASILHQSAWWHENSYLEDYFSRMGYIMSRGEPCCDLLVINPVESVWCRVYPGWSKGFSALDERVLELERLYRTVFEWLSFGHIDFDYGDEGMISQYGSVCSDDEGIPALRLGSASYRTVLVCGMDTMRSTTAVLLESFIKSGGKVIFAGDVPAYLDAVKSSLPKELAGIAVKVPLDAGAICREASPRAGWTVKISYGPDKPGKVLCRMRHEGGTRYIMLLNLEDISYHKLDIDIGGLGWEVNVFELCCTDGELLQANATGIDGGVHIATGLEKYGERIFILTDKKLPAKQVLHYGSPVKSGTVAEPCAYVLDEPNICVLDRASCKLGDGSFGEEMEILKLDRHLRRELSMEYRNGEMLQPWFVLGRKPGRTYRLEIRYGFDIADMPPALELALEHPELFEIYINGCRIEGKPAGWWVDRCFSRIPLPVDLLNYGRNNITLKVEFHERLDIEAVYLLGNFGVSLDGARRILTGLPELIRFSDLTAQGLPFYSGGIKYKIVYDEILTEQDEVTVLETGKPAAAYLRLVSDSGESTISAWPPFRLAMSGFSKSSAVWLGAVLTRRNTFGPLHLTDPLPDFYGPDTFITDGDEFKEEYSLLPMGVLSPPRITVYRRET